MTSNIHPIFAPILAQIAPEQSSLIRYRKMLASHDWHFEYADSHGVWEAGRNQFNALLAMSKKLDPDFSIWNSIAPASHQRRIY